MHYMFDYSYGINRGGEIKAVEIRKARIMARYTQQQVADLMGVSRPTYRKLEENPELMTFSDAKQLADIFGMSVQDIFFGQNYSETYSSDEEEAIRDEDDV